MSVSMVRVFRKSQQVRQPEMIEDADLDTLEAYLLRSRPIAQRIQRAMKDNPEWWLESPTALAKKLADVPGVGESSAAMYAAMYVFAAKVRKRQS